MANSVHPSSSARRRLAGLIAAFLLAGCASSAGPKRPWIYAMSREAYGGGTTDSSSTTESSCDDGLVFTALLPFVLDMLLLPVTVTHDLAFME